MFFLLESFYKFLEHFGKVWNKEILCLAYESNQKECTNCSPDKQNIGAQECSAIYCQQLITDLRNPFFTSAVVCSRD